MADKPKVVLGVGALCCGEGCGIGGCEREVAPVPAPTHVELVDEVSGSDK